MSSTLFALLSKLNSFTKLCLEESVGIARNDSKGEVTLESWLILMLSRKDSMISLALQLNNIATLQAISSLKNVIVSKGDKKEVPPLSSNIQKCIKGAWDTASLSFKDNEVNSFHILYFILSNSLAFDLPKSFYDLIKLINTEDLKTIYESIYSKSFEKEEEKNNNDEPEALIDLIELAKLKKFDRAIGREKEINQIVDILLRKKHNNPIILGEAGVGKTAIIEELSYRILEKKLPKQLQGVKLKLLDVIALQAGASIKGEFEERLKNVIQYIKNNSTPMILFIDEIHSLIGAGNDVQKTDTANFLKPALARGDITVIGATTWWEYKKYIEKDNALARRFSIVRVDELGSEESEVILRGIAPELEKHHNVVIKDDAIKEAIKLSTKYDFTKKLPDKAIALLDSTCSKVNMSQVIMPSKLKELESQIEKYKFHILRLKQENMSKEILLNIKQLLNKGKILDKKYKFLNDKWQNELKIVKEIKTLPINNYNYNKLLKQLHKIQVDEPFVFLDVDKIAIRSTLSEITNIPFGKIQSMELESYINLEKILKSRILGQEDSIKKISQQIRIAKTEIESNKSPQNVFLLVGPSGVGKTETALAIANTLYGSEENIITIHMTEYKESHKVASLIGSPPGYIGYGEGGKLTEQVKIKPYSVILLDEIEKAHPDVQELFLQVFDKGVLTDSEGNKINFKNTTIIMTSNVGTKTILNNTSDQITEEVFKEIYQDLLKNFKPEFIGRTTVVPYNKLSPQSLESIAKLKFEEIKIKVLENYNINVIVDDSVIKYTVSHIDMQDLGARQIEEIIKTKILSKLSEILLQLLTKQNKINKIIIKIAKKNLNFILN